MSIPITLAKLLNVGTELEYGGKTYKLTEATIEQQAELATWVEQRAWQALERRAMHASNPDMVNIAVRELNASIAAGEYEWGGVPVMRATRTYVGQKKLVFIVLRANHPELLDEQIEEIYEAKRKQIEARIAEITSDPLALSELVESFQTGGK